MKKILIFVVLVLTLFFAGIYIFVPANLRIEKTITVDNIQGVYRSLSNSTNWKTWWPGNEGGAAGLNYHDLQYRLKDYSTSTIFLEIKNHNEIFGSEINFIPGLQNTAMVNWGVNIPNTGNPLTRIRRYFLARSLGSDLKDLLKRIKKSYSNTENIYGLHIEREHVKNSALVFTYDSSKGLPSTEKIYRMVEELKKYITDNHAHVTDSPMVNINTSDSIYYLSRVAVPADTVLKSEGKISYKWMLGGGNILTSEVVGSSIQINHAFKTIELYMDDYHLSSPAIPFYALSTNRLVQKDSTKWKSKIYYPVMYY